MKKLLVLLLAALMLTAAVALAEPADTVIYANIYTSDTQMPWAQAVAIRDGVFTYVGDAEGVSAFIGENTEVRPGAFLRGSILVGDGCVVGNSTELKNCILFDGVQVPHYDYVGDSILGYKAHMGAGAITSNVKGDKRNVVVHGERDYETGRKKFGAMLGDFAEIGCNSVLNPGTIIGRDSQVYPLSCVRGVVPARSIVKGERGVFKKRDA